MEEVISKKNVKYDFDQISIMAGQDFDLPLSLWNVVKKILRMYNLPILLRATDGRILSYYSFLVSKYVCVFSLFLRVIFSCWDLWIIFWHYVL